MDVQKHHREARIFSILNDNDCPSFVIRSNRQSPPSASEPAKSSPKSSYSPRQKEERPSLLRHAQYTRTSSFSSAGSPPLLRLSSSSSKDSNWSMDSSPSPATPAYNYLDNTLLPYDPLLRQDMMGVGYLPSPTNATNITPFLEQQLMITPNMPDHQYSGKPMPPIAPAPQYSIAPAPLRHQAQNLPAPEQTNVSLPPLPLSASSSVESKTSSSTKPAPPSGKKNKYPCPYAQSHNCQATFTTSGHAARHGKKHTGEKGVHCPICNKAFTRKDNMKQHERTHKDSVSSSNSDDSARRSKAAITKDAQKNKQPKKLDTVVPDASRRSSLIHSPLSEVTSLAPTAIDTPLNVEESVFYSDQPQTLMPIQTIPESLSPNSLYPPLGDDSLLSHVPGTQPSPLDKLNEMGLGNNGLMPPTLIRGYSDLDTLAQAAESFNPYYSQGL